MQVLGNAIGYALGEAKYEPLSRGQWHLPYFNLEEFMDTYTDEMSVIPSDIAMSFPPYAGGRSRLLAAKIAVSAATCARTSYQNFEGKQSGILEDIELFKKLIVSQPIHASPLEHQACPDWIVNPNARAYDAYWCNSGQHGNLVGWRQARKFIPYESGEY